MQFDEKKAAEIIQRFGLSETTLKVWRSRGSIPDRYAKEQFQKREAITGRADRLKADRVCSILRMNELNIKFFSETLKCSSLFDISRKKSTFTDSELLEAIKEIKRLRLDVIKTFEMYSPSKVERLLKDKRIKPFVITQCFMQKKELQSIRRNALVSRMDFERLKDPFMKFALQLSL